MRRMVSQKRSNPRPQLARPRANSGCFESVYADEAAINDDITIAPSDDGSFHREKRHQHLKPKRTGTDPATGLPRRPAILGNGPPTLFLAVDHSGTWLPSPTVAPPSRDAVHPLPAPLFPPSNGGAGQRRRVPQSGATRPPRLAGGWSVRTPPGSARGAGPGARDDAVRGSRPRCGPCGRRSLPGIGRPNGAARPRRADRRAASRAPARVPSAARGRSRRLARVGSKTSSQGTGRRWRSESIATLRATRRIHAVNGTSRGSYLWITDISLMNTVWVTSSASWASRRMLST